MKQQNLQERICSNHPQNKIILTCINKYCNQNKLICCSCLGNHAGHIENLYDKQKVEEKITLIHQNQDSLIKKLNSQFDELNLLFNQVKQGIEEKYYLSIQKSNSLNNDKFSEYITQVEQFDEFQETILKYIEEGFDNFVNKLQLCLQIIGLSQLSYIQKTSNEDIQKASDLFEKGKQYYDQKAYEKATQFFKEALSLDKYNIKSLTYIGDILRLQEQFQESIEYYEKAIFIDQQSFESVYGKGLSLQNLKQYQEAIKWLDKAIQIDPQRKCAFYEKGLSLSSLQQYSEAIECFDRILQIDPQFVTAYYYKGDCLKKSGQLNLAIKEQEKALQINQNFELALVSMSECLTELQKFDEAQECANKILKFNPNSTAAKSCLSIINTSKQIYQIQQQINSLK